MAGTLLPAKLLRPSPSESCAAWVPGAEMARGVVP